MRSRHLLLISVYGGVETTTAFGRAYAAVIVVDHRCGVRPLHRPHGLPRGLPTDDEEVEEEEGVPAVAARR